jgi:hypothetical protein
VSNAVHAQVVVSAAEAPSKGNVRTAAALFRTILNLVRIPQRPRTLTIIAPISVSGPYVQILESEPETGAPRLNTASQLVRVRIERRNGTIIECVENSLSFMRGIVCAADGRVTNVDEQWEAATSRFRAALAEFEAATGAVIAGLKTSEPISDAHWQRERQARNQVMAARDLVARLARLRKLAEDI